jgi:hypothetical protein
MTRILPAELPSFWRRYLFNGGSLRRVKLTRKGRSEFIIDVVLGVQSSSQKPVKLKLQFVGVEEYRFAKRPGAAAGRVPEARCSYLSDLFFLTLDAWNLEKGELPKPHDFRASDAYVAARELWFEEIVPKAAV